MRLNASIAASIILIIYLSGCVGVDRPDVSTIGQSVVTDCSSLPLMSAMSSIPIIDRDKELIIRHASVVDDPCRTAWNGTGCANGTVGAWTFGQLMATMSGNPDVTSSIARDFVRQWLAFWLSPQTNVNPDRPQTVAARPLIGGVLLWRWLNASGCSATTPPQNTTNPAQWLTALQACPTLDLRVAPFRLLAISNRIDLDGRDYNGNGAPGELRFAYGNFNTSNPLAISGNAEVILEYHYPNTFSPIWWAFMFHNLSGANFGPAFSTQLQSVTDLVVGPNTQSGGAQPGNPNNGSSIAQIRTDENAFDIGRQWEFRQFELLCTTGSCPLSQVPVSQTPPTIDNNSQSLTDFIINNRVTISSSLHVVPSSMLGASSLSPQLPNSTVWNTTGDSFNGYTLADPSDRILSFNVRHNFAFSTCNGCHYLETANTTQLLFHINPRAPGAEAPLSEFLNKTTLADPGNPGYPDPNNRQQIPDPNFELYDPFNGQLYFEYNEIWRRACEIRRIFSGSPTPFTTATGHH